MSDVLPVACQCPSCGAVTESNRPALLAGLAWCIKCNTPLSVLNIVPLWDFPNLTDVETRDSN